MAKIPVLLLHNWWIKLNVCIYVYMHAYNRTLLYNVIYIKAHYYIMRI